jgi:rubrerythrin
MAERFNADEVFEIAEQIERNGAKFYRRASEVVADAKARDLLAMLADMELRHEKTFQTMREEMWRENPDWLGDFLNLDAANEAAQYLQAVANGRIFDLNGDAASLVADDSSLADVLKTAIGLEKDTIVFYLGIKEAVPDTLGKEKMDAIIFEEMSHVRILSNELATLAE